MEKPSFAFFVYTLLAVGLLLLLLASSPRHHRRLKLRSNFSFSPSLPGQERDQAVPFNPIVADFERRREDREWARAHYSIPHHEPAPGEEAQPEWEDFFDAEDFLNDDERFNLTHRLVSLFPSIDVGPADGFLSAEELTQWNLQQEAREVLHRTKRDMELHDKNRDGFVSPSRSTSRPAGLGINLMVKIRLSKVWAGGARSILMSLTLMRMAF